MPSPTSHAARPRERLVSSLFALVVAGSAAAPAAAPSTWLGGQTTPAPPPWLWSDPTNWVSGAVPTAGGTVVFSDPTAPSASLAATRNDLPGLSVNTVAVNGSATGPV